MRAGDVVVALGGVSAADTAFDHATVATRNGQNVTLRVRRQLPGGGHGPEEDVVVRADPVLAAADKKSAAARDAAIGLVFLAAGSAALLRWPGLSAWLALTAGVCVAAAFGLRAWDVAFPAGVALWRGAGSALIVAGAAALLAAAASAVIAFWRGRAGGTAAP